MTGSTSESSRFVKDGGPKEDRIQLDISVCKRVYRSDFTIAHLYSHQQLEISMVVSGSGIHRILNQAIPCKEGDIYIVGADIPHGYFVANRGESVTVQRLIFDVKDWFLEEVADPGDIRYCYGVFNDNGIMAYAMLTAQARREIDGFYHAIAREITEKGREWQEAVRAYLTNILITVGRYVNGAIKNVPSVQPKEWGVVSSAMGMVTQGFSRSDLTLESIARSLYISKSHLSRLFKRITGESFSGYIRCVRLEHACRLLRDTRMTVEEIVGSCGLRDIPSFYQMFHAHMNMTPHQYRSAHWTAMRAQQRDEKTVSLLETICENLQKGHEKQVMELVQKALDQGIPVADILERGLLQGMSAVGEQFKNNQVYVPEVLMAARAMNMGTKLLKPYFTEEKPVSVGRVCLGTVQGDLHDIGKNLVKMMMEGKGLEVIDLGTDVAPETFVQTAVSQDCKIICCSALLTTTMGAIEEVVKAAERAGIRHKVKIMIGGGPVTEEFCKKIGADCYTSDAASAAEAAVSFCKG